jgi:mannitol/fructose-specific phosphotransferase system IIA component (Ntr-type)
MKISDFFSPALMPAHIMIDLRTSDKSRLLEQLSAQAAAAIGVAAADVAGETTNREKLGSTGVAMASLFPMHGSRA